MRIHSGKTHEMDYWRLDTLKRQTDHYCLLQRLGHTHRSRQERIEKLIKKGVETHQGIVRTRIVMRRLGIFPEFSTKDTSKEKRQKDRKFEINGNKGV